MGIFFKARGNVSLGLFLIRISLGLIFLLSGSAKILNLEAYTNSIKSMGVLNENLAFIVGFVLPFIEIIFGSLFIIGLFTPLTSFILSMLILSYLLFFGAGSEKLPYSHFIVFLACTLTTLFGGAGVISFDALMDKSKKKPEREIIIERPVQAKSYQEVHSETTKEEEEVNPIEIEIKKEEEEKPNKTEKL